MKLYVGTYAKYNRGSIAGAWLDLDKFKDADEFAAACRRLHKDESDMKRMRRGYMVVRERYRKRLNAYWKRFGASKIHTWTYWTEA